VGKIQLVDTSLRDGNQCLWGATGVDTAKTLTIAPLLDRVGFKAIDFTTSTHMGVAVRFKQEDPWERIRLTAAAMPRTPLQFMSTGFRFISWETASPEFMNLVFATLVRNGIRRFCLADPMNDVDANLACARMVKSAGGEFVIAALVFTVSPIHDDAMYAECARRLSLSPDVDALYIKDPGGLLSPKRAATLIPAIRAQMGSKGLELHSHSTIGLAESTYLEAADLGISALQCAAGGLGDGISNPPAERVVSNLLSLGHIVDIDTDALREVGRYFSDIAASDGLAVGSPQGFDADYLNHQLPGGMIGTMRRQLAESRMGHLEAAVIKEISSVRRELGWPIVMTPFAQMVMTQAFMNITTGKRYSVIPDEVIRFVIGRFGRPTSPIDPDLVDRIEALPRTKELRMEPDMASVSELRRRLGGKLSDEEFLLRATMPSGLVDAMQAAGSAVRHYDPRFRPVLDLIRGLTQRRDLSYVSVEKSEFKLELKTGRRSSASSVKS